MNEKREQVFKAKRIQVTHRERVKASAEQFFSLACPVEELKWIDSWQFDMIYSESGKNENNCIFKESMSGLFVLNRPELSTCWYTTIYDTGKYRFDALLLYGSVAAGKFEFHIAEEDKDFSTGLWMLTYTSLSEDGNNIIDESFKDRMLGMLTFLGKSAKHYLETGEIFRAA